MAQPSVMTNLHHRKVELQSPNDLTYLQSNLVACARQKLDLHFPPSAAVQGKIPQAAMPATTIHLDGVQPTGAEQSRDDTQGRDGDRDEVKEEEEEDPLRARVRAVVDAFIARTWEGACKNITVNGLDATNLPAAATSAPGGQQQEEEQKEETEGVDFVYSAYDSRLQAQVASLYGELETLTTQVSKLRRTAPAQGAETLAKRLREEMEADDLEFEKRMAKLRGADAAANDDILKLKPLIREGWFDDVNAMYERGTNELAALAGIKGAQAQGEEADHQRVYGASLTETLGKIQRARTVAMEFE
ncbi:hypothetical protein AYO22_01602 [Fonsecaea multimorphosa]|nr:hypothetical protein AYO22_01602 [Fonsecaea multimorphosa]